MRRILCTAGLLFLAIFLSEVRSVGSSRTETIRVALFLDAGAHARQQLRDSLLQAKGLSSQIINGEDIRNGCLKNFDVLVVPGGSGMREADSLSSEGREEICNFVRYGGSYMGICAGCYLASESKPEYLGLLPIKTVDKHWRRGRALLPIEFTKLGQTIFGLPSSRYDIVYHNGPVFKVKNNQVGKSLMLLSYFRGEVIAPNGIPGLMNGAPAMVLGKYGQGLVLGISPHPEGTPGLEQIELHAIRWLFDNSPNKVVSPQPAPNVRALVQEEISLPERLYDKAEDVFKNAIEVHYRHLNEDVNEQVAQVGRNYRSKTDCSGFVSYIVNSIAPRHYSLLCGLTRRSYPHAALYARFFTHLPTGVPKAGWLKISDFRQLRRGDIIAWGRPDKSSDSTQRHDRTGHVMIVADPASKIQQENIQGQPVRFVEVNVIDSSGVRHFPPECLPPLTDQSARDGLGKGHIRLILNDSGNVIGYWEGSYSETKHKPIVQPTYTSAIGFARLISLQQK